MLQIKSNMVLILKPQNLFMKKLTSQQVEALNLLANLPDDEIDISDISEQTN